VRPNSSHRQNVQRLAGVSYPASGSFPGVLSPTVYRRYTVALIVTAHEMAHTESDHHSAKRTHPGGLRDNQSPR
jgi:hypothetical protein